MGSLASIINPYLSNLEYRLESALTGGESSYTPNSTILITDSRIPKYCSDSNASRIMEQKLRENGRDVDYITALFGQTQLNETAEGINAFIENAPPIDKALAAAEVLGLDISELRKLSRLEENFDKIKRVYEAGVLPQINRNGKIWMQVFFQGRENEEQIIREHFQMATMELNLILMDLSIHGVVEYDVTHFRVI